MRICLVSREYPPDTGWGGIGSFMYHLGHALTELEHEVHVISLTARGSNQKDFTTSSTGGPTVHRVASRMLADRASMTNFSLPVTLPMLEETSQIWRKFLHLHAEKPFDVVECPEHFAEGLFPGICAVAPLVLRLHTPHSKLVKEKFHNFCSSFDHRVLTSLERVAMLSADLLVSPSQDLASYVAADLNIPENRIHIVRNPVDSHRFKPEGDRPLKKANRTNILFVGRLEARKGVHYLVEAVPRVLASHPQAHFLLAGSDTATEKGNGSVRDELKRVLVASGVTDAVTFLDHIPLDQMPAYYRSADVFVLPSLYDNAPMTAIEAMSCGVPVVSTSAGGTKEYVVNEKCGLIVPPANTEALANALSELVGDADKRLQMGRNARKHVEANLTREINASQTVELYKQAIQSFRKRAGSSLYPGEPETLASDLSALLNSYERAHYDMMYTYSWRFRLKHMFNKVREKSLHTMKKVLPGNQPAPHEAPK